MPLLIDAQVRISGQVIDSEKGTIVSTAIFEVHESGQTVEVDASGFFEIQLAPGTYHLHIQAPSYEAWDLDIKLKSDTVLKVALRPTFLEIKEVLIEDSFLKTVQRESSQDVELIHLGESEKGLQATLAESLRKNPGLEAYNTGVGVAKPIIRGFTATRISVFDQGIRQEGQQWGMDHGLEIDPFNANRIEVIKGPGALQYGSGAIGGVLKLLPDLRPKEGISGGYSGIYKSNNKTIGNSINLAYANKEHFLSARISQQQYEDFRIPADEFIYNGFILPITDNTLKNTAGELFSYRLTYGFRNDVYNFRLVASRYEQKQGLYPGATGIPRAFDVGNIGSTADIDIPNQEIRHSKVYAKLNVKIGDGWLTNNLGYQYNDRNENSNPLAHGFLQLEEDNILALGLDLQTLSHNSRYNWQERKYKFTVGLDQQYQRNNNSGWEYLLPNFALYEGGVFGLIEGSKSQNKWNWNAGARLNFANINSQQHLQPYFNNLDSLVERSPDINREFFNYSLALGLSHNPNENWNFKANLARSFRVPVPAELASNGVHHGTFRHEIGNPDINPEVGYQLDLGLSYQQKDLYWKLSPFFNYFSNYIFLRPSALFSPLPDAGQMYIYSQTEAIHMGSELFFEYHPIKQLHLATGLEYVYNVNLETSLPLPFTPPLSNLFTVEYEIVETSNFNWSISAEQRLTAAQKRTDRNELETPAYELYNFRSNLSFKMNKTVVILGASILNAFDTAYLSHLSRYRILNLSEQGRNVVVHLNLIF